MRLSRLGEIVRDEWYRSAQIRREIELIADEFVVMPNHIHGIVRLIDTIGEDGIQTDVAVGIRNDVGADGIRPEEEGASLAPQPTPQPTPQPNPQPNPQPTPKTEGGRRPPQPFRREGRSLGSFVAGFKAAVTARPGELIIQDVWQRNYYEHIIRNQAAVTARARRELIIQDVWQRNYYEHIIRNQAANERIRAYIQANPLRWTDDQLHPAAPPNPYNQEPD